MVNVLTAQLMRELKEMALSVAQTHAISDKELWKMVLVSTASSTSECAKMPDAALSQLVDQIKFFIRMVLAKIALSMRWYQMMDTPVSLTQPRRSKTQLLLLQNHLLSLRKLLSHAALPEAVMCGPMNNY